MNSIFVSILMLFPVISCQWLSTGQQSSQQQPSPYPRIKIGGPLGQLIPNGIQLGSGLGSLMNQLIGTQEPQQESSNQQSFHTRPSYPQQLQFQQQFQHFSPQKLQFNPNSFYSDSSSALYGTPALSSSGPFTGHSSQLGSTNSELFSHSNLNSQVFPTID